MAWERDVLIVRPARRVEDVPDTLEELELRALGSREDVHQAIDSSLPEPMWQDPWSAVIDGDGWMIEANMGVEEPVRQLMLRIHGASDATPAIAAMCRTNSWSAIDVAAWEFIDTELP